MGMPPVCFSIRVKGMSRSSPCLGRPHFVALSPLQAQLQGGIRSALALIGLDWGIVYFVYDGALGNNASLQAVKQAGLHWICQPRHDSTLVFPTRVRVQARASRRNR